MYWYPWLPLFRPIFGEIIKKGSTSCRSLVTGFQKMHTVKFILCLTASMNLPRIFQIYRPVYITFSTDDRHYFRANTSFIKIGAVKDMLYLWTQTKFCSICYMFRPPWIKFGPGDVRKNLLGDCELRENVSSERHTLLPRMHKFQIVLSTSNV